MKNVSVWRIIKKSFSLTINNWFLLVSADLCASLIPGIVVCTAMYISTGNPFFLSKNNNPSFYNYWQIASLSPLCMAVSAILIIVALCLFLSFFIGVKRIAFAVTTQQPVPCSFIVTPLALTIKTFVATMVVFAIPLIVFNLIGQVFTAAKITDDMWLILQTLASFATYVWALKYKLAHYAIIDTNCSLINGLKESTRIMKGYRFFFIRLKAAFFLIIALSLLPVGLGLLITLPTLAIVDAVLYVQLKNAQMVA